MSCINENTWPYFLDFCTKVDQLNCQYLTRPCGTKLVDAGVNVKGGLFAGLRTIELSTAGLARANIILKDAGGIPWPHVEILTDQPLLGCFLCQAGNRTVSTEEPKSLGSGPACLLADRVHFKEEFDIEDNSDCAVLIIESSILPDNTTCEMLAGRCGVHPSRLGIVVAPTASLAGTIQVAGRSVETALHKINMLDPDLRKFINAVGRCPVACPGGDDLKAIGRVNDAIIYGAQVWLTTSGAGDDLFQKILPQVPSSNHPYYGRKFLDVCTEAGGFFNIDMKFFSPAEISIVDLESGRTGHAGSRDDALVSEFIKA